MASSVKVEVQIGLCPGWAETWSVARPQITERTDERDARDSHLDDEWGQRGVKVEASGNGVRGRKGRRTGVGPPTREEVQKRAVVVDKCCDGEREAKVEVRCALYCIISTWRRGRSTTTHNRGLMDRSVRTTTVKAKRGGCRYEVRERMVRMRGK